jgi:hypothetical protein
MSERAPVVAAASPRPPRLPATTPGPGGPSPDPRQTAPRSPARGDLFQQARDHRVPVLQNREMSFLRQEEEARRRQQCSQMLPGMPGNVHILPALPDIRANTNIPQVKSPILLMDDIVLSRTARSLPVSLTECRQDHVSHPGAVQKRAVHRWQELEESQGHRWLTSYDLHLAAPDLIGKPRSIARRQGQHPRPRGRPRKASR